MKETTKAHVRRVDLKGWADAVMEAMEEGDEGLDHADDEIISGESAEGIW